MDKPKDWYNRIQVNFNASYSMLFKKFTDQKFDSKYQRASFNINGNAQFKNLWWVGGFIGYAPRGNDFYEPRTNGYSFRTPQRIQLNPWFESNSAKKYYVSFNYFLGLRDFGLFNSPNHEIDLYNRYRFSDKFSITQSITYNPVINDAGFYSTYSENNVLKDIIFSRRNITTVENILAAKYNFNNKSGITFRARHYWSKVKQQQLYDLKTDGKLSPTTHTIALQDKNLIFLISMLCTHGSLPPGSFINIVWKRGVYYPIIPILVILKILTEHFPSLRIIIFHLR